MEMANEVERQMKILTCDVSEVIPASELREKLENSINTGIPLRVKMGIDPTSPDVHLGHMVVYKKMRQFQDLGHTAILIIGDYTARIGDPTGRNAERPPLTDHDVQKNSKTYTEQIFKIVDPQKTEVHFQSSWFDKVSLQNILTTASAFSVAQMLTHDTFKKRLDDGNRLSLHEMFYPLLQAWDSVFVKADVELGGTDQKFNVLCGRDLQKTNDMDKQVVLLMPLLMGTDGKKMSKTLNNHIPVLSTPEEKFGRIMSISDDLILNFFTYSTSQSNEKILELGERLKSENPRDIKIELAKEIIAIYHGNEEAERCEKNFISVFSKKEIPDDIPVFVLEKNRQKLMSLLKESGTIQSISEGRRLVIQGGLRIDGVKILDPDFEIVLNRGSFVTIKAGKRRFLKISRS